MKNYDDDKVFLKATKAYDKGDFETAFELFPLVSCFPWLRRTANLGRKTILALCMARANMSSKTTRNRCFITNWPRVTRSKPEITATLVGSMN